MPAPAALSRDSRMHAILLTYGDTTLPNGGDDMLHIIGTIIIGFVAGVLAKLVAPGL
jgi:hypothetical protein